MNIAKKILKILLWTILIIIAIYSSITIIQRIIWKDKTPSIFGYKNFIVLSGSMHPTLKEGDLVFVKESNDFKTNDIIAFKVGNSVITHRIIEIKEENNQKYYITKGDANSGIDNELITSNLIEGKYQFKIPKIGHIVLFFQKPLGLIILLLILGVFLFLNSIKPQKKGVSNEK